LDAIDGALMVRMVGLFFADRFAEQNIDALFLFDVLIFTHPPSSCDRRAEKFPSEARRAGCIDPGRVYGRTRDGQRLRTGAMWHR
jgi:hypothetical protein